jgi:hypothetical protein
MHRNSLRALRFCVSSLGLWALTFAGCNRSGLNLAPVSGVVRYNGAPVAHAGVMFVPETGPYAIGTTDAEGRFTLKTANHEGAIVGSHKVAISKHKTTSTQVAGEHMPRYNTKYFVPEKYASPVTSELTATVEDDDNNFDFELTGTIGSS